MLASKRLNVQMYVPTYVVQNPEVILKMGTKNLKYDHIISSHSEVQAQANYENTVVVSQSKIKRLIMLVRKGASYEKSRSCLSCVPGTLGDTHQITDLQVQYGSLNMFENPVQYDWEHWKSVGGKYSNTANIFLNYNMEQVNLNLSQTQLNKLLKGDTVQLKNSDIGQGHPITLATMNVRRLVKADNNGSGMRLTLTNAEIKANSMNGSGFNMKSAKKFANKVGKNVKKGTQIAEDVSRKVDTTVRKVGNS
jgi:hypothetical protein